MWCRWAGVSTLKLLWSGCCHAVGSDFSCGVKYLNGASLLSTGETGIWLRL